MASGEFSRNLACVIGINHYQQGIPPLKTAVNDAQKIAQILSDLHGYQVWLLLDEGATFEQISHLLEHQLKETVQASDRLIFYFAGHGIALNGDAGPEGYLIPQDAQLGAVQQYFPMTRLQESLTDLPCRHFLGIFDCCFAGAFRWSSTRDIATVPEVIHQERYERFIQDSAWQVITSADYDQKALDAFSLDSSRGQLGDHSPFAAALIESLQGAADAFPPAKSGQPQGDGVITATELYLYLRDQVEPATSESHHRQTPGLWPLKRHDKGEYIFLTPGHALNLPPSPPLDESLNPYRGLESFEEIHHDLFFGRNALIHELQCFMEAHPLTIVLGPSGSGKSSLVKAGLMPTLKAISPPEEDLWHILSPIRPGKTPLNALHQTLIQHQFSGLTLEEQPKQSFLLRYLQQFIDHHPQHRVCLVIDQYEELITLCQSPQDCTSFQQILINALTTYPQQLRLILTLRSDYEPHFQDSPFREVWPKSRFIVPAMTRQELRAAIEEPASSRVMYFEPSQLVDQLIDEVAQMPGALPLLSFTLSELYCQYLRNVRGGKTRNRAITQVDYEVLGGVARSLTQRADAEYEALVTLDSSYNQTIQQVMLRMIAVEGGELARRQVPLSELDYGGSEQQRVREVIQNFTTARLLVEGQDTAGNAYVEPAHDALVRGWQRLRLWQKEAGEHLILQRQLTLAAKEWERLRKAQYLWHANPRLALLKQRFQTQKHGFNRVESKFIQQSLWLKRRNIIARWSIAIAVMAGLGSLAILALLNQRTSIIEQVKAAKKSAEVSLLSMPTALDGMTDSLQAGQALSHPLLRLFPPTSSLQQQVKGTLLSTLFQTKEQLRIQPGTTTSRSRLSPDGQYIASAGEDGTIKIWTIQGQTFAHWEADNLRTNRVAFRPLHRQIASAGEDGNVKVWTLTGELLISFKQSTKAITSLAFSPDGQIIVAGSQDGKVGLWTAQGRLLKSWTAHQGQIKSVNFSPDGQSLVTAGQDAMKLWSQQGKELQSFQTHAWEVIFSPNGQTLIAAGDDGNYSLWSIQGKRLGSWQADEERLWAIAVRPDGKQVATAGENGIVRLWDQKGVRLRQLQGHIGPVRSVSYGPDNQTLLSSGDDGSSRVWLTRDHLPVTIAAHANGVNSAVLGPQNTIVSVGSDGPMRRWSSTGQLQQEIAIAGEMKAVKVSPNGQWIAIATADGKIHLRQSEGNRSSILTGHKGTVYSLDFSPNGYSLLSAGADGTVRLWSLDGKQILNQKAHNGAVQSIQFSPEGERFVSVATDSSIRLWDLKGTLIHDYRGHLGAVQDVAFSPNGQQLASSGRDGTVRLWNVAEKKQRSLFRVSGDIAASVAFSSDGRFVVSGDDAGGIQIWDMVQQRRFAAWQGHSKQVSQVVFNGDGTSVLTAGKDGTIKIWSLPSFSSLIQKSCDWMKTSLENQC